MEQVFPNAILARHQCPDQARRANDGLTDPQDRAFFAPERSRTPRVDENGVLFSARRTWPAGQPHSLRSDRAREEVSRQKNHGGHGEINRSSPCSPWFNSLVRRLEGT